jgi:SAM-dependent methyltransferase
LRVLVHERFDLPCGDPWLEATGTPAHAYLDAARQGWREHPEYMDFLDLGSPVWDLKQAERDLYLALLDAVPGLTIGSDTAVLDVGCGIGRMTQPMLDRGATVYGTDGDLESLRRCVWHAAGRAGRLDLFWTSLANLPDVTVDLAFAVEVLPYTPDPAAALRTVASRVRSGGIVFLAMEGRWGWAVSPDAPLQGLDIALSAPGTPGPLAIDDRFVQIFDEAEMRDLVASAGLEPVSLTRSHYFTTGPLEALLPDDLSMEQLQDFEARARVHPVWAPLNRIWVAVARVP